MRSKVQFQNCLTQQNVFSLTVLQLNTAIYARYAVSRMLERKEEERKDGRKEGNKDSEKRERKRTGNKEIRVW